MIPFQSQNMTANENNIGFIVLPPGHGKSHLHSPTRHIFEADSLVPYNSSTKLQELRKAAKISGNWSEYDAEWTSCLAAKLPKTRCILLVPSQSVGKAAHWTDLGGAVLTLTQWSLNLQNRPYGIWKYYSLWCEVDRTYRNRFADNTHLQSALLAYAGKWIAGDTNDEWN